MLDDKTLALLGDREAAERLTESGVLLECPYCKEKPATRVRAKAQCFEMSVVCFKCGISRTYQVDICDTEFNKLYDGMALAIKTWNTRAPILTPAQLTLLRIGAEPRKFEEEEK